MKVCMRGLAAYLTASQQRSMSISLVRARPQIIGPSTVCAICFTASKSPSEAIGNPASMTSTPRLANCRAMINFSEAVKDAPGLCSPSRRVVSKIIMRLAILTSVYFEFF